ncbi:MAG TPA: hypothetical protein VFL57_08965 [Bryobacteraceae bacterium]|nr:hypothetical protein [Bryobacteraceae bacterium]
MLKPLYVLVVLIAGAGACRAIEIATGKMLGTDYDQRSFYVRAGAGRWARTYSGAQFRPEAAGRMMNLRIAQGIFHDEWLTEAPFDPDAHTARIIAALDTYKAHGILAISVSLQGANMAYEVASTIRRTRDAKPGPAKGALMSAFHSDGSPKKPWLDRALRLAKELDRRGMVLNLIYFYAHQDEVLENTAAIDRAAVNATDWIIDNNLRNVVVEIANEHDVNAWDHDRYVHNEIGKLIQLARSRFDAKRARFRVPISASTGGGMRVYDGVRSYGDLTIVHGNNQPPEKKRARIAELVADPAMPGPIYMNEDDNGRATTPTNLKKELASCDAVFESGGSWGYMPWRQLQIFPFAHVLPSRLAEVRDDTAPEHRDPAYFNLVLKHIRSLVFTEKAIAKLERAAKPRRPDTRAPNEFPMPSQRPCITCSR